MCYVLCAMSSFGNSDPVRTVQKECAGEEIRCFFFVSTDFPCKVQRGPLCCCCSDIWASQQKGHQYFMLNYFQLAHWWLLSHSSLRCSALREQSLVCSLVLFTRHLTFSSIKLSHWERSDLQEVRPKPKSQLHSHLIQLRQRNQTLNFWAGRGGNHIRSEIIKMC